MESGKGGALQGVRVLEVAGQMTGYCGKLLAELGAEVVLVEAPEENFARRQPPFIDGRRDADASLSFAYYNTSKKSITLDLDQPEGCQMLRDLVADYHILIEGEPPGALASKGLDYKILQALTPSLVMTSLTAFGQTGPYANFAFSDLTLLALGGMLYLAGYPDTPPMGAYGNQAINAAGMYGAVGTLIALRAVRNGQPGRHVDVSAQECVALGMENAVQMFELEGVIRKRFAGTQRQAGTSVFASSDGYVLLMAAGLASNQFWLNTVKWLISEGVPRAEELGGEKWLNVEYLQTEDAKREFLDIFGPFAQARTSEYLYEKGQQFRVPICPVCSPRDVVSNAQLRSRNYFVDVPSAPAGRDLKMPGPPYRLQATPWRIQGAAPSLGEHNIEIYSRAGVAASRLAALASAGVL